MRPTLLLAALALACAPPLAAQKQHRQPLDERQIEQIREAGVQPDQRIQLYTHFVAERVDAIEALGRRASSRARGQRLDDALLDLAALLDELGANLDQYGDRKADLRKALKALNQAAPGWQTALTALAAEPAFELSRKEALEALRDFAAQSTQLEKEQVAYFETHKDERGQERAEPK